MRISMAGKIYSIIAILLAVAAIIVSVSLVGINRLSSSTESLGQQAKRIVSLDAMVRIMLERRILLSNIIDSDDEAQMTKWIDGDMRQTEADMQAQIRDFHDNFAQPLLPVQVGYVDSVTTQWADYVKLSNEAAALSLENSNNKANRISRGLDEFWDGLDAEISALTRAIPPTSKAFDVYSVMAGDVRNLLTHYRMLMSRFISERNPAKSAEFRRGIMDTVQKVDAMCLEMSKNIPRDEGGAAAGEIYNKLQATAVPAIKQIMELVAKGSNAQAVVIMNTTALKAREKLTTTTTDLVALANRQMGDIITGGVALARTVNIAMIATAVCGIALAVIVAYFMVSGMVGKLKKIIAALTDSSDQVRGAAGQISDSSQSLAEGSTQQAASLEETSSALEEMASMTRQNADNATKTNNTTQGNNKLISVGSGAVANMSQAMGEISDSAEQINRIIKTIEDIAFQTNLLALNAAVEAARAGEAGKGFAVVADEVRNLAGRSAQAARDTTQLIQTTIERVKNGSDIARELDHSFKEIEEGSNSVSHLISEIAAATNEQAQGVDQVNTAVAQMDKVTQSNAATAEQAASAAEQLSAQSDSLHDMVADLVSLVDGRVKSGAPVQPEKRFPPNRNRVMKVRHVEHAASTPSGAGDNRPVKMLPASEVIPLGDEGEF